MVQRLLLGCLLLTCYTLVAQPQVYRWKDEQGNWVYSDVPRKGSEKVDLNQPVTMPAVDTTVLEPKQQAKKINYELKIASPGHLQTIRKNTGSVYVTGHVSPVFSRGLKVQLFLDGKAASEKQTNAQFALRNVERGEHKLIMHLFNEHGTKIASSSPSTFYLHRTSQVNP